MNFSTKVLPMLEASGWSVSRHVRVSKWIKKLTSLDLLVNAQAEAILVSFGGLVIRPWELPEDVSPKDDLIFDPIWPAERDCWVILELQEKLNVTLTPVGERNPDQTILIATDGRTFTIIEDSLVTLDGWSFVDAMENTYLSATRKWITRADFSKVNEFYFRPFS